MDVAPEKFDADFWVSIAKTLGRLAMLAVVVLGGSGAVDEITTGDLKQQEAKAATVDNRVIEAKRETNASYEDYHELVRYHAAAEASCDSALESFARHRDDERDFVHLIEECHSEGEIK